MIKARSTHSALFRFRTGSRATAIAISAALASAACTAEDLADDPTETTTAALTGPTSLVNAFFVSSAEGFTYSDDAFRGTAQPTYASGAFVAGAGFHDGAVRVRLGNVNDNDINNMSGAWGTTFTIPHGSARVTLIFRYNLVQSPNYEADEFSEINASLDGTMIGPNGADWFVRIAGDGEGGPDRATGWHIVSVDLGVLSAGQHVLKLGGDNNKKTAAGEFTDALIDEVRVTATPVGVQTLINANFNTGTLEDGFVYSDDTFRGTSQPAYALGSVTATEGFGGGGAIQVLMAGQDEADILGMSGGWSKSFTLDTAAPVSVSFRYDASQSPDFEADEYVEVNLALDGVMVGPNGADWFVRLAGDGEGGPVRATGWHNPTLNLGTLAAGTHTLTFGGYTNKKTASDEISMVKLDDVVVTATY